jgi:tRNA (guanine37-N1)-methyltransferase
MKFNVLTLLPNLFEEHLSNLPFKRAILNKSLEVNLHNLRDYALDSYGTVDDKPYGGGVGMVLMIEPIYKALTHILGEGFEKSPERNGRVIVLSPRGKKFTQKMAQELAKENNITFISGRYEGIDARVEESLATDVISIGDYVLSGGELPALVIMEAITRLIPGVLEKDGATEIESFSDGETLEFSQYTRPENFKGLEVPKVLLSGNHKEIENWRKNEASSISRPQ